jgi:hypothetical protein
MSTKGDEPATNEPDPPDGKPDGEQGSQDDGGSRHKRKKRPHLRTLARALFFAARVLWWWLSDD